jgi:hexulose-6-phosphate isomerase
MSGVGFMQGRLSPLVDGKIQAFPWDSWEDEFGAAGDNGFPLIEWTLDHDGLDENPLMTPGGRQRIAALSARHNVQVASVTGDCFMQAPFFKAAGKDRVSLMDEAHRIVDACVTCGVSFLVIPLVDNGRIENEEQHHGLLEALAGLAQSLPDKGTKIVFESDYAPAALAAFMDNLPAEKFGINYDIGNSASAGFDPVEEIDTYGARILNVHVKDRVLGGTTVPLGDGNADFPAVFAALRRAGYTGNYILQTARAPDDDHLTPLINYRDRVHGWLGVAA